MSSAAFFYAYMQIASSFFAIISKKMCKFAARKNNFK